MPRSWSVLTPACSRRRTRARLKQSDEPQKRAGAGRFCFGEKGRNGWRLAGRSRPMRPVPACNLSVNCHPGTYLPALHTRPTRAPATPKFPILRASASLREPSSESLVR